MKTERDHIRELIESLRMAVASATAIGFYRNQEQWMMIAALLDNVAKKVQQLR